jgi:hypothetical protein
VAKAKPLVTRLRCARILLRDWRSAVFDGHVNHGGPDSGKVTDPAMVRELARFNAADAALAEAIKKAAA